MNKSVFAIALVATSVITFSATKMFMGKYTATSQSVQENQYIPLVQTYYSAINAAPSESTRQILEKVVSVEWVANPSLSGGNGIDDIIGILNLYYGTTPNIKFNIQDVLTTDDRIIVRTTITGTPGGKFMGISATQGKSFEINAIDIHTIKDGKLSELQHVEDWSAAIKQVNDEEQSSITALQPASPTIPQPQLEPIK